MSNKHKRCRLDATLMELGLFPSRQVAQAAIMNNAVLVNGTPINKPGTPVDINATIQVSPSWEKPKYASRGGLKLEKALAVFQINPQGCICLDIGASTGGFTDCLLKHGALRIYAIDVGYGQLDWNLRQNPQVIVKEHLNARYLQPEMLYTTDDQWANLAVLDVSFISILKVLPACLSVLKQPECQLIGLIKPQFEAHKSLVERGGIIKSPLTHIEILETVLSHVANLGLRTHNLTFSPLKGPAGNIEYLALWSPADTSNTFDIPAMVREAHQCLSMPPAV